MIFHDKPDQQLCDDDKLIAVLNDGDQTAEHQEVIEHIEQCSRCQQRFDELAAGAQDWSKARQALLNDDPCSENRVGSAKWDYSLRNEGPVAWTESMACQLLSPASHPELLGRLGRYDVERLIGSGGMGVVFKAHDSELNRPVAIKILAPYLSSSGPARKRFAREARAAAAVVQEHVVPIYNVETEREIPFLVMHYVAGESLQERVDREGALELCEILRIGMQVASGLSAAHQQGLVHRDIKPSNILMEQGVERALITDFGLARAADDASLTRTGFHPGTPQYMSPEQAAGEQVDARSDLFSLGSVLYTMCTGRPPFRAETSLGVLRRITDVEPRPIREINPNIPEWLSSLVARLMSKSPEDRFVNANEVAELLKQCLAHVQQPTAVPLPTSLVPPATTVHRPIFKATRPRVLKMLGFVGMPILGMVLWQAMDPPSNNLQQPTVHGVAILESVISDVTITEKTTTVSGRNGKDMDCVLRIGKSKKNEQLEWATPVTGKFSATITASDQIASDDGQVMKGIVFTIQNEKVLGTSNIAMSDGDPVPAGEVRFRQLSAMDRADTFWTIADIHCDDGTTIPISILLRANKPLLPAGPLVYKGKVQEWVGENRYGEPGRMFEDNYKPVPNATLQLYKVSPIVKGGAGYQFEEIAVFKTDKAGYYNVNIPDDLKRFIPTPHTKEWDDWDSLLLITTSAPGFATNSMTLAANYNIPSIELARGTSINGRLVDENGKPVVGARVTVNEQSRSREREMDGWLGQTSSQPLQADKFDATDANAMLAARTRASIANHSVGWIPPMIEGVMTDSDGRFTIDGIGTNDFLDLKVEATGYKDSSIKVIGRDIKTAYSRDPFASGENIAVHGRNFQVTIVASDRNTIHNRHRVLKDQQVHRNPVSTAEKEMFDAIDNRSPGQRKAIDGKQPDWLGDLQGDWIVDSFYFDEDANSRELQKQGSTALILRTIRVEANELYFRNPPVAGMTRTSGAISLKPVEGNDPRLFSVVDSQETFRFGMYKVDGDKLTILLTEEAPPKLLAPTKGEFYIECHRAVSEDDKELLNVINKNPDQINVIDLILKDFEKSVPAQGDATTTGNVSGTEKPSPTQAPDTSNGESMDLFQEVAPPSTPDATSKLDFFTEGFHKLVITGNTSRSEYMHLKIGDEPDAQEWILGLGGRFIATFEYSDELSVKGGKKANGLRIGVKHGNGNVSRLQIEMTPVDSVSASSFRFREGALGKPLVDAAILYHEGRYRIGDVETIDGKKLPVFVQLKDVTSATGPNAILSK